MIKNKSVADSLCSPGLDFVRVFLCKTVVGKSLREVNVSVCCFGIGVFILALRHWVGEEVVGSEDGMVYHWEWFRHFLPIRRI